MVTSGSLIDSVPLKLHHKYSVFVPFMRNPLPSKASLHWSSNLLLASSLVYATKTISSSKGIHHGVVSQME